MGSFDEKNNNIIVTVVSDKKIAVSDKRGNVTRSANDNCKSNL